MTSLASPLWRGLQAYQVYGANTNVGKTVVSTLLCKATANGAHAASRGAGFLKPVSTGPLSDADDRHMSRFAPGTVTHCLHQFHEPISPHLAAAEAHKVPRDEDLVCGVHKVLAQWERDGLSHAFVETAGGVHSPGPSGTSQADLYRPLRLPVILVADYHLGGISSSISAYESLLLRGYDVQSVLMFKDPYYRNSDYLAEYFGNKDIPLLALQPPPDRPTGDDGLKKDERAMAKYYDDCVASADSGLGQLLSQLSQGHERRIQELETMAPRAHKSIWYPFTQHNGLTPDALTVIDSARGDHFQVFQPDDAQSPSTSVLSPVFDGSASWWTQGLGHGNPQLALAAAYAAGRYGHVMFALGAHEPAIELAELLLRHSGNERLSRVFYSDNGSTGMEVAVKMGLHATCHRYGWDGSAEEIGILGLKGSYHGDTIGTMDCSEPSTYNKSVEWYRGRGHWLDFPQVKMVEGVWTVELPQELARDVAKFPNLSSIFDVQSREDSDEAALYRDYIRETLQHLVHKEKRKFGALILEPIVLGAGGMLFVDPLFQHVLIQTVRSEPALVNPSATIDAEDPSPHAWSGLPIIFDEVFTGLYRLFHFSASNLFPQPSRPDIVVNAKLLTGGLLPLATTMASEDIFAVFNSSPAKEQALLHGHSYTAHPVGCHVARVSLKAMMAMERDGVWDGYKDSWAGARGARQPAVWSIWDESLLVELSHAPSVESVRALGTILTIVLRDQSGGGYTSSVAQDVQRQLRSAPRIEAGEPGSEKVHFDVQSRVLGNVFYLMTSLTSTPDEVAQVEEMLRRALL